MQDKTAYERWIEIQMQQELDDARCTFAVVALLLVWPWFIIWCQ